MEELDILYTSDNKYIDILMSSMYSIIINSNLKKIRFHIVTSGFTLDDYKKIEIFFGKFSNVELEFYSLENFNINDYNIPNWKGSQIANARLFFQDIMGPKVTEIKNLLYLDSDTVIVSDLTDLVKYKNGLFLSKDIATKKYYKNLFNLDSYYNSGVIFINIEQWTKCEYQERIIKFIEKQNIKLTYPDQDILNCSLNSEIKELPIDYNMSPYSYFFNSSLDRLYYNSKIRNVSYEEIKSARMDPKILHSYGFSSIKPWDDEFNPFYKEFMKYLAEINPEFEAESLKTLKKIIIKFPELYKMLVVMLPYMPLEIDTGVKKLILKLKKDND